MQEQHTIDCGIWIDYDIVNAVYAEWKEGKLLVDSECPMPQWWPGNYVLPTCNCPACKRYWELKQKSDEEVAAETTHIDKCMEELLAMREILQREMVEEVNNDTIRLEANPLNVFYAMGILHSKILSAIGHLEKA